MPRVKKPPVPLEKEIQKSIMARMRFLGLEPYRRNVAAMTADYKGKRRFIKAGEAGQSDIWSILPDKRHVELEVKRPGEEPTVKQLDWLHKTNAITGASFWADDPQVAEDVLKALMGGASIVYQHAQAPHFDVAFL